jgi:hypothetical protein
MKIIKILLDPLQVYNNDSFCPMIFLCKSAIWTNMWRITSYTHTHICLYMFIFRYEYKFMISMCIQIFAVDLDSIPQHMYSSETGLAPTTQKTPKQQKVWLSHV